MRAGSLTSVLLAVALALAWAPTAEAQFNPQGRTKKPKGKAKPPPRPGTAKPRTTPSPATKPEVAPGGNPPPSAGCLLYTSDAADEL